MKVKPIVGLIVVAVMLSALMVGCEQATPGGGVYTEVSVGRMTVSIPTDWERPEEYAELTEDFASDLGLDIGQDAYFDAYEDESEHISLLLFALDMKQISESEDTLWEGWDIMLEEVGWTKEDFATIMSSGFIGEVGELTREVHQQVTIHGNEAWESQFTGNIEGEPARTNLLIIFAPDDLGVLVMVVEEAKWGEFEATWDEIRDSVELPLQA